MEKYSYRLLLQTGEARLADAGIEEAKNDAWILFESVTKLNRTAYFMRGNEYPTQSQIKDYFEKIKRRGAHEPLQYIEGYAPFMGYLFQVNPSVLIPRMDTEILVEQALRRVKQMCIDHFHDTSIDVLDMCTGSGCIIISIFKELQKEGFLIHAAASDLSKDALQTAKKNAEALKAEIQFYQGDLFSSVEGKFDMIVSNPPYIRSEVIKGLAPEVRICEPMMALDGYEDGLFFYRKIVEESCRYLKTKGYLIFEIGYDQALEVRNLLSEAGYDNIKVEKDLAGLDRVVIAQWNK